MAEGRYPKGQPAPADLPPGKIPSPEDPPQHRPPMSSLSEPILANNSVAGEPVVEKPNRNLYLGLPTDSADKDPVAADPFAGEKLYTMQQDLNRRIFSLEGQVSDLGFRIADHDGQLASGEGITGKAKRWPVLTSQIVAAVVNALILLNPTTWQVLPDPLPILIPVMLQAVAAVIGGQFTHSKAEINERLQDGNLVKPLAQQQSKSSPTLEALQEDLRNLEKGSRR